MQETEPTSASPLEVTDEDRAWVRERLARMGADGARVHAGPRPADGEGRIVLHVGGDVSASAPAGASLSMAVDGDAQPSPVFAADALRVGAGESLVVRSAPGRPATVLAGVLDVAHGGRVVVEADVELHARRAAFGDEAPIVLVGRDGKDGHDGADGAPGGWGRSDDGGDGERGEDGEHGEAGPGGTFVFKRISGTLTVVAGGGSGGNGGRGGRGGNGYMRGRTSDGGNGGNGRDGGTGGDAGDGGTIIIIFETMDPDASIQPVVRMPRPGKGGKGGGKGMGAQGLEHGRDGTAGHDGKDGAEGAPPALKIRVKT